MTLKRALEKMPPGRETEPGLREVVRFFAAHVDEWIPARRVASVTALSPEFVEAALSALSSAFVLDSHDEPAEYRYRPDRVLELEVRAFLRKADDHAGRLQSNVEKFRSRYGGAR